MISPNTCHFSHQALALFKRSTMFLQQSQPFWLTCVRLDAHYNASLDQVHVHTNLVMNWQLPDWNTSLETIQLIDTTHDNSGENDFFNFIANRKFVITILVIYQANKHISLYNDAKRCTKPYVTGHSNHHCSSAEETQWVLSLLRYRLPTPNAWIRNLACSWMNLLVWL